MPEQPTLETPRLRLRPLALEQTTDLFPLYHDPLSMRWWQRSVHQTENETATMIAQRLRNARGEQLWTIYRRDTDEAIGNVSLIFAHVTGMGYLIRASDWRQGYGAEAMTAALDYVFEAMSLSRVELWIDETNLPSQGLARKLGFRQRGQFYAQYSREDQHETLVYGLRADEWAARQGRSTADARRAVAMNGVRPVIQVASVPETLAFYRDRLGFNVDWTNASEKTATFAIVSRGEWTTERARLHLSQVDAPVAAGTLYIPVGLGLDRLHDELVAKGVRVVKPITTQPYGTREFQVVDHNGWTLTFASDV